MVCVPALWCPLATPTILLGFLLLWTRGISSRLLQQSADAPPYLGRGVSPHSPPSWPWTWSNMKKQNDRILKEKLPRSVRAQYITGDQWRNNSRKKEGMEPKQKQYPVVDVTGDRSKAQCCKKQYCIGTWNVRSMNQIGSAQTGDGKSEHQHSRNLQT